MEVFKKLRLGKGRFVVEETLGAGLLFAALYKDQPADYALLASNQYNAQRLYEFLLNFLSEEEVVFFPADELLRAESLSSSRELLSQRLYGLHQLLKPGKKILVTHPSAALRFLPDPKRFAAETTVVKKGSTLDLSQLKKRLVNLGYEGVNKVDHSLQFASRGDILDVYTVAYPDPVRIEFWDDEVDSIRTFDPQTQESRRELGECSILPASDIFLNEEEKALVDKEIDQRLAQARNLIAPELFDNLKATAGDAKTRLADHDYRPGLYKYFGLLKPHHSVLEYFAPDIVYLCNSDAFSSSVQMLSKEANSYLTDLLLQGLCLPSLSQYLSFDQAIPASSRLVKGEPFSTKPDDLVFQAHKIAITGKSLSAILPTIQSYLSTNDKVVLCLSEPHQEKTVKEFLTDGGVEFEDVEGLSLPSGRVGFSRNGLSEGFEVPCLGVAYLSANELFGRRIVNSRFTSRFKEATILRSYEDLRQGDYVVHEYNGIGQFIDVQTIEVDGVHRDFLHIAYANNEYLYVPLEQFRLVRKYAGREGAAPKLSSLSSKEWEKKKKRIKSRINELADRLIALYGERAKQRGYAFLPDDELQRQFEEEFPYQLTEDQQKAVDAIKSDMEKPEIMDRLICGDVGFGKTEVAFRAAFKAIDNGKQVALLCPTTLLARQHYEVAMERFSSFGVHIALFSRLIPEATQKANLKLIEEGKIDLVIGTHRLLSKDFRFHDLGLLIVDEEQRFGVEQKEWIKEKKKEVDVLTLSATPIPRTLQMSLVGIRPMSEINTAPSSRMPIQTYVTPYSPAVVDELIARELARGGQVFYVHNKVMSIYATAYKISSRNPQAQVGVVHGQMDKEEIESVMADFYDGKLNVLVCTSIVENGIDIPNANMIIVEDADTFGLSQLYQIKGRVGRGQRIAYAYLMYRPKKNMNEDAKKRLQAIQEFTELGSGYKIAQRDLMIRGAGDILGPEQAGFIDSVGLDLYLKMLNEAVSEKKNGKEEEPPKPKKLFDVDAYIPKDYANKSDKIELYQELESIDNEVDLNAFEKKLRDIYGRLPEEVKLLIVKARIDILSESIEFESVKEDRDLIFITLSNEFTSVSGIGNDLFNLLVPYLSSLSVSYSNKKLVIRLRKGQGDEWLKTLEKVLRCSIKAYESRVSQK